MRTTHTYVTLELSRAAYDEIKGKMLAAKYQHAINAEGEIDMHGIAVTAEQPADWQWLTREEACAYLMTKHGVARSPATLATLAVRGGGPVYRKIGQKLVHYSPQALDEWVESITEVKGGPTNEGNSSHLAGCSVHEGKQCDCYMR